MRLLRSILAAVALCGLAASCADSDAPLDTASALDNLPPGTPVYLAFNLVDAASLSRADDSDDDPKFINGTEAESKIKSINFYFFNEDGSKYLTYSTNNSITITDLSSSLTQPDGSAVGAVSSPVIMLRTPDNPTPFPSYVVAAINLPSTSGFGVSMDLNSVRTKIISTQDNTSTPTRGNMMTNSVYMLDGKTVDLVNIKDCLMLSEEAAKQNPVTIYVERTSARVDLIAKKTGSVTRYCVTGDPDAPDAIFAHLLSWRVVQNNTNFFPLKEIDPSWTDSELGFKWNDPLNFRCYWSMPYSSVNKTTKEKSKTYLSFAATLSASIGPNIKNSNTVLSFLTRYVSESNDPDCPALIFIAAQLQDKSGNPHPYFRYMSRDLDSEEAVIDAIALTFKGKYWTKIGGDNFTPIAPADIDLQPGFKLNADADSKAWGRKDYETVAQLRDDVTIYKGGPDGSMPDPDALPEAAADVNKDLASFPALIASNGYVYYFLPITHLGGTPGFVRNHLYQVNVNSISGLGTPVFEPWTKDQTNNAWSDGKSANYKIIPLLVTGTESHVDADIKVHSWRIVDHHYVLDNANP